MGLNSYCVFPLVVVTAVLSTFPIKIMVNGIFFIHVMPIAQEAENSHRGVHQGRIGNIWRDKTVSGRGFT